MYVHCTCSKALNTTHSYNAHIKKAYTEKRRGTHSVNSIYGDKGIYRDTYKESIVPTHTTEKTTHINQQSYLQMKGNK